jgi:hypothetical protein
MPSRRHSRAAARVGALGAKCGVDAPHAATVADDALSKRQSAKRSRFDVVRDVHNAVRGRNGGALGGSARQSVPRIYALCCRSRHSNCRQWRFGCRAVADGRRNHRHGDAVLVARTSVAALSDALVSHTIAKLPHLSLGECAIALSCEVAVHVQVRRAFAPPLAVAAARVCRCHHSAQLDRFDVIDCIDVGGTLVSASTANDALPSDAARIVGPMIARALVPVDMARIGGCDASAPLVVVPHIPARETDDLMAAMAASASNGERFAALVDRLTEEGQWLVVRAGDDRLFALVPRSGGAAAFTMHEYLPPPSLVTGVAVGKQPATDSEENTRAVGRRGRCAAFGATNRNRRRFIRPLAPGACAGSNHASACVGCRN